PKLRMNIVVPLFKPRQQLENARQERDPPLLRPAFLIFDPLVISRNRLRKLQVIPTRPGNHRRWVDVALAVWEGGKPFFWHVELSTQNPVARLAEIFRFVPRRWRDIANLFCPAFLCNLRLERLWN